MVVIVKLFLSVATGCMLLGYGLRRRDNRRHRRLMAAGIAVAWAGACVLLVGRLALDLPLRPAFWLHELAGGERGASLAAAVQQGLVLGALLLLVVQAVLGRLRHPLHRPLALGVLPFWLLAWVTAMFAYA